MGTADGGSDRGMSPIGRITRSWLEAFSAICRLGKMVRLRMLNIQSRFAAP